MYLQLVQHHSSLILVEWARIKSRRFPKAKSDNILPHKSFFSGSVYFAQYVTQMHPLRNIISNPSFFVQTEELGLKKIVINLISLFRKEIFQSKQYCSNNQICCCWDYLFHMYLLWQIWNPENGFGSGKNRQLAWL